MELRYIPMVSISALTGQRVTAVIDTALEIKERLKTRVPSAEFENRVSVGSDPTLILQFPKSIKISRCKAGRCLIHSLIFCHQSSDFSGIYPLFVQQDHETFEGCP